MVYLQLLQCTERKIIVLTT